MHLGDMRLEMLSDGTMRFDGGAFFGVVPRVLWERLMQPDERNRVTVGLNCPLIQIAGKNLIIDTGVGTKHPEKRRNNFAMEAGKLTQDLRAHGLSPADIDYVILSHLHFDHAGGTTHRTGTDALAVTFPKAQHLVQREDWEEATHPNERNAAGYFEEDLEPLKRNSQLELLDGDTEILPGLWCKKTGGHTAGHQIVVLEVGGRKACFFGDLIPTVAHLPLPYSQGFDLYPVDVLKQKQVLLDQALREQWLVIFDHEREQRMGYLEPRGDGRLKLKPLDSL